MRMLPHLITNRTNLFRPAVVALLLASVVSIGCSGERKQKPTDGDDSMVIPETPQVEGVVTAKTIEFPEGDASVPAEQGGPGFTGEGWQTATPGPLGDSAAVPGGMFTTFYRSWPENVRIRGTGANTYLNSIIESLCYETLLGMHPTTLEPIPQLASHWQIEDDDTLFRFRLNPRAYWSDGKPVTSDDVIATYRLIADDTLVDPMMKQAIVDKMEEPKKISKYIFEVRCKSRNWRNFLSFTNMAILPAHQISNLTGSEYINRYSGRLTATTGPYVLLPEDVKQNQSLAFTRRTDYWGDHLEQTNGLYNFTKIRFVIVLDQRLSFDKALKGECDFHAVYTAQWWVEDLPKSSNVNNGYVVAQKIFTKSPAGTQGMAMNLRRKPLDDVRVRKALAHLFDRKTMLDKFAYNEYDPLKSYFPASDGENPDNQMVEYDPAQAVALLREAGFTERDRDGVLMRDGKRLSLTIMFATPGFEKYFTTYQEACRRVGVEIKLDLVDHESEWKRQMSRDFEICNSAWTGNLFPDPKSTWHSNMADRDGSNNTVGFQNEQADRIIEQYDDEFDLQERNALLRQLDGVIFNEHPYALEWYAPSDRILYLNKFGMPQGVFTKYADWRAVFTTWWVDPDKERALIAAMKNRTKLETPPAEVHYWAEHAAPAAEEPPADTTEPPVAEESAPSDENATDSGEDAGEAATEAPIED